ncbi:sulfatase [Niabella insulamsoli]|uniref:sulfatase family protein n=1 Tax=Niabella insulamsoli TaxID=3144874 RepID=UPI0031FDDDBB
MHLLKHIFLFGIALSASLAVSAESQHKGKPNIIIFFTDDQGYGDLSCYGNPYFKTPHIDQLANDGLKLTRFYMAAPVCTPSRASLLSGKYAKRLNLHEAVIYPYSKHGLNPDEILLPELLKKRGYATACIGKWHLGNQLRFLPINQGFDYFYGVPYSNDMDGHYYQNIDFRSPPLPVYKNETVLRYGVDQDSLTQLWTTAAVDYIKANDDQPFFLYLAHNMPHLPWHASKKFRGKSGYSLYGDAIQELDWSLGEIRKALQQKGIDENTIIIFTSDNGPVTNKSKGGYAGPLRGAKATTWEGGLRVPGIFCWPGKIPSGSISDAPASSLDILPTLVKIAGGRLPKKFITDGRDISQLLLLPASATRQPFELLYYGRNGDLEAYSDETWKIHTAKKIGWNPKDGLFPISLYHLKNDVGESNNVAASQGQKTREMTQRMAWMDQQIVNNKTIK